MQKKYPWAGKHIHLSIILFTLLLMAIFVASVKGGIETGPSATAPMRWSLIFTTT
jgi:hypothetical protein